MSYSAPYDVRLEVDCALLFPLGSSLDLVFCALFGDDRNSDPLLSKFKGILDVSGYKTCE